MKLLVVDHVESFSLVPRLKPILEAGGRHKVWKMGTVCTEQMWQIVRSVDPDVIMAEFADANAAVLSRRVTELSKRPKLVVRLHGYESQDAFLKRVAWENVSALVVVSPYFERLLRGKVGGRVRVERIENGVDLARFPLAPERVIDDRAVAVLGYLNHKKGPALMRFIAASMPERTFHLGGIVQEESVARLLADARLSNLTMHGWVKPEEFLPGKRWIMSTSLTESFSFAVAEGMAAGLTPLVHGWPGAEELWPPECVWRSFDQLRSIEPRDPAWCRQWVADRYPVERCVDRFIALFEQLFEQMAADR